MHVLIIKSSSVWNIFRALPLIEYFRQTRSGIGIDCVGFNIPAMTGSIEERHAKLLSERTA